MHTLKTMDYGNIINKMLFFLKKNILITFKPFKIEPQTWALCPNFKYYECNKTNENTLVVKLHEVLGFVAYMENVRINVNKRLDINLSAKNLIFFL